MKVSRESKIDWVIQNSSNKCTKEFNPKSLSQSSKIKNSLNDLSLGSSIIDHAANVSNRNISRKKLHAKKSIYTVNKNNIIVISNEVENTCIKLAKEKILSFPNKNLSLNVDTNKYFQSSSGSLYFGLTVILRKRARHREPTG